MRSYQSSFVATNDCHYLNADDVEAHDVLLCIQTQAKVNDAKRMRFEARDLYYKSAEEMEQAFKHIPEALSNTVRIAEECHVEMTSRITTSPYTNSGRDDAVDGVPAPCA